MPDVERKIPQDLGLSPGQWFERDIRIFKNAAWRGATGEDLGGGDIAKSQPQEVASRLEMGELVAIVPSHLAGKLSMPSVRERLSVRDGVSHKQSLVSLNFGMLIVPRCIYLPGSDGGYEAMGADEYPSISRKSALELIHSVARQNQ